ncbi:MAG: hypothetical protein JWQ02_4608 [Capsulimonas sp.]|nr:hypothetical protein [Capsulimonas sp.]
MAKYSPLLILAAVLLASSGCVRSQQPKPVFTTPGPIAPTVQSTPEFEALFTGYPKNEALSYAIASHKTDQRLPRIDLLFYSTWFLDGNPRVSMESTVDLLGEASDCRDVYQWAVQATHERSLSDAQLEEVRQALSTLPKSGVHPPLRDLLIVSFRLHEHWETRTYDKSALPASLQRIYHLTGAPLSGSSESTPQRTTADITKWKTRKMMEDLDIPAIKAHSEKLVTAAGGKTLDWLPYIDRETPRTQADLTARTLILNALVNIAYGAPITVIKKWIADNGLTSHLSSKERALLEKRNEDLTDQEKANLHWSMEAVWALIWAGGLTGDIPIDAPVSNTMASLLPNLQKNESSAAFTRKVRLRPYTELYPMLDLYYRAHWSTENARLHGGSSGKISGDIIMERRKALEWLMDSTSDWDDVEMST